MLLTLAMLVAWAPPAGAQTRPEAPLVLDEVLRATERHYPPLDAATAELRAARGELLAAQGAFDTALRANAATDPIGYYRTERFDAMVEQPTQLWGTTVYGGYRWGRGTFAPYDAKLATADLGELRAGVRVPLLRNGPIDRRRADIRRLELAVAIAAHRLEQQRLEATRSAAMRYWEWAMAAQRVRLTRALVTTAEARDAGLRTTIRLGETAAIEGTENARAIQQRRAQLVSAERTLQQAAIELSLFTRGPDGRPVLPAMERAPRALPPTAPFNAARLDTLAQLAQRRRPEVLRLLAQAEQSEVEMRWAANQHLPGLDLQSEISQDLGQGPPSLTPTQAVLGVSFDLPLQRRFASGRLQAASATMTSFEAQARFMRDRVAAEVLDAGSAVAAAAESVAIARQEAGLADQLAAGERERFRLGATTMLFVNLREQAAFEAAIREAEALAAYHRARAGLDAATAVWLDAGEAASPVAP